NGIYCNDRLYNKHTASGIYNYRCENELVKDNSDYQFALEARGRKDEKGDLAEDIFDDLSLPRQEKDFHALSDYIEMQGSYTVSMSVFDSLYDEYTEWLKF